MWLLGQEYKWLVDIIPCASFTWLFSKHEGIYGPWDVRREWWIGGSYDHANFLVGVGYGMMIISYFPLSSVGVVQVRKIFS